MESVGVGARDDGEGRQRRWWQSSRNKDGKCCSEDGDERLLYDGGLDRVQREITEALTNRRR